MRHDTIPHFLPQPRAAWQLVAGRLAVSALATLLLAVGAAQAASTAAPEGWQPAHCGSCGVVESVNRRGGDDKTPGIGAAAGAVVGGVIGRNLGSHENRTLATLLGAIGGGLIGHRIEQHHQARNAGYDVAVRMSDGSRRVLQQAEAPSVGQWVRVEGERLVPLDNSNRRLDAVPPMSAPLPSRPQRVPLPTPGGPLDAA